MLGFLAVLLPMLVAFLVLVYALAALYGAQEQASFAARTAALAGMSAINGGPAPVVDRQVTAAVTRLLQNRPFSQVLYTTSGAAPAAGVADITGSYAPSGATLGSSATTDLAGTTMLTATVTLGVHITWGTLGPRGFTVQARAVAMNCQGTIVVNATCPPS